MVLASCREKVIYPTNILALNGLDRFDSEVSGTEMPIVIMTMIVQVKWALLGTTMMMGLGLMLLKVLK